ncbi:acyl-CoA synthetase FdrA, partial [Escherichia coli]
IGALANYWHSEDHTLIDMGDVDFTRGKPHPMIDPTLRNHRLLNELNDSHTAVVLFELVLGYGASTTPASE